MDDFSSKVTKLFEDNVEKGEWSGPSANYDIAGKGNVVSIGNNNVNITSHDVIVQPKISPGEHHITNEQAYKIKNLVDEVVLAEKSAKRKPRTHAAVWGALKKKFKFASYRMLEQNQFDDVLKYLQQDLGRLRRAKGARTAPDWRKSRYRFIHARLKQLGKTSLKDDYIAMEFGVSSLKELNDNELQHVYDWVATLK